MNYLFLFPPLNNAFPLLSLYSYFASFIIMPDLTSSPFLNAGD